MEPAGDLLAASGLPRAVTIGGTEYVARAPTLREAVELFTVLRESIRDPEDEAFLENVLRRWWGDPRPRRRLWWRIADPGTGGGGLFEAWLAAPAAERLDAVGALLFAGVQFSAPETDDDEDPEGDPPTWEAMLGAYCEAFGGEPWQIYNHTPFPFFVAMYGTAARQLALRSLRDIETASVPHMGEDAIEMVERLQRRAGVSAPASKWADRAPPEIIERDRARLLAMGGR